MSAQEYRSFYNEFPNGLNKHQRIYFEMEYTRQNPQDIRYYDEILNVKNYE